MSVLFPSRMTQGIFVGHHDRKTGVWCITKKGVVRGKGWTRQTLIDAWESTKGEGLCGTPWQMVAPALKLTKKVTADKEGAGPPLPRIVVERAPEVDRREAVQDVVCGHCIAWTKLTKLHTTMNAERESERSVREP